MKKNPKDVWAIDARMIESSGIGTYIRMLMGKGIYDVALGDENVIRRYDKNIVVIPFNEKIYGLREQLKFPYGKLKEKKVTLFHSPHYNTPLFWRGKLVVTIHDLIHLKFPKYLPNKMAFFYAWVMLKVSCIKACRILTVSEYSKQDLIHSLGIRPDKVSVTYNAVDSCFHKKEETELIYLKDKYAVKDKSKIILYVGNLKPHKNLKTLLCAFAKLENKKSILALVGKAFGDDNLKEEIKRLGIINRVILTGAVSQGELIDWYNFADIFVFPSLYEGFGIPPLEAMACGTPVASSNAASLPEVVGDAAVLFEPQNIDSIQKAIEQILNGENHTLIEKGYVRSRLFDEEAFVQRTEALLLQASLST